MLGTCGIAIERVWATLSLGLALFLPAAASQEPAGVQEPAPAARAASVQPAASGTAAKQPAQGAATHATGPVVGDSPVYIFLNAPADLDAFWRQLASPDFVLQKGADYQKLLDRAQTTGRAAAARSAVIGALAVRGDVQGDIAHLTLELEISIASAQPVWVPIRLDGLTLTEARERERALPLREAEGAWQIELGGAGKHSVQVELLVPVKPSARGLRIEMAIPEVAATEVDLRVPEKVVDAIAGVSEPVAIESIDEGKRSRLSAHLAPRKRLELTWRLDAGPGLQLAPLLSTRGEIAIEADPGALRMRSSWVVSSTRGMVRELVLGLDPADELLELQLDDQPLPVESRRDKASAKVTVPLAEPLRPGESHRLVLTTRRPLPAESGVRIAVRGLPLTGASAQTGVVAIGQGGGLWVDAEAGRGLRQVDLRELPADLRRPSTVQAYQFLDQPFELVLRIDPAPPQVRVEARSTLSVDAGQARLDTWLDYQVTRGRVFELTVGLPKGLELEGAGPEDTVESYHWLPESPGASPPDLPEAPRVLTLRLTPKARDESAFRVHLVGRQSIDTARVALLALFRPRGALNAGQRIAVRAARNVTVELAAANNGADPPTAYSSAGLEPPADWPWPSERAEGAIATAPAAALWLRAEGSASALPLRVAVQPRTVHHDTNITARLERKRLDVRQETICHVRFGSVSRVDIAVPPQLEGLWDLDGDEVVSREQLQPESDGQLRYRLILSREVTDALHLQFRYRLPMDPGLVSDRATPVRIAWLRVLEGSSARPRVSVSADPGIDLALEEGSGWMRVAAADAADAAAEGRPAESFGLVRTRAGDEPPVVLATARALAQLPAVVASRLWLRTVEGPEGELRTTALYRLDAHESAFAVALPAGAELVRARVGSEAVREIDRLGGGGYRLRFPAGTPAGPVVCGLEYRVGSPAGAGQADGWEPPRLLEGGLVQQTLWEVAVPWNRAVVGVPAGWSDENRWYWDVYALRRRPLKTAQALTAWVGGGGSAGANQATSTSAGARARLADDFGESSQGGYHSYLFRGQGNPAALHLQTASRAWLVGVCSGVALALGMLILAWRPRGWLVAATIAALALAAAIAVQPSVALLVTQSSLVGVALTFVAGLTQWLVERRRQPAHTVYGEPSSVPSGHGQAPGSSLAGGVRVGSDDSTAIRVRPGSTQEHLPAPHPPAADIVVEASGRQV